MTRVADLTGAELDLWVARAIGGTNAAVESFGDVPVCQMNDTRIVPDGRPFAPHEDWAQGGPIIERERLVVWPYRILDQDDRAAGVQQDYAAKRIGMIEPEGMGPSYLIAAMRAFVASKFGETVTDQEAPCA